MSPAQQIVFLHILKTAGQSVMQVLELNYRKEDRLFVNEDELIRLSPGELQKYKIIYGHNFFNIHQLLDEKPVYFTFLRDPIERTLSHYAYLRRAKYLPSVLSQTLEEFVSDSSTRPYIANYQTRWLASMSLTEPANLNDAGVLELAKERLDGFAFVGIVEEFKLSVQTMARIFDWKLPWVMPKVNVFSTERLKREELSSSTLEVIQNANLLDIELYQHGREVFESQYKQILTSIPLWLRYRF